MVHVHVRFRVAKFGSKKQNWQLGRRRRIAAPSHDNRVDALRSVETGDRLSGFTASQSNEQPAVPEVEALREFSWAPTSPFS